MACANVFSADFTHYQQGTLHGEEFGNGELGLKKWACGGL